MGWAARYVAGLLGGETVQFRPRGNSMSGKIDSGRLCTVEPVDPAALAVGDVVLCKVNGREYLHLIKAIQGDRFQIGNNRGRVNGWISPNAILGKRVRVERATGPSRRQGFADPSRSPAGSRSRISNFWIRWLPASAT